MIADPILAWTLTVCFAAVGIVWLVALTGARRRIDRGSFFAHVLMSASMAIMPWAWSMAIPALLQVVVFTVAALWYVGLLVLRPRAGAHAGHHDGPVFLGYHAAMMAAMVWMSALMTLMAGGAAAGPSSAHAHGMSMPGMDMPGMTETSMDGMSMGGMDAATGLWQQPLWALAITLTFVAMFLAATVCMLVALMRGRPSRTPGPLSPVAQTLLNLVMAVGMGGSFLVLS